MKSQIEQLLIDTLRRSTTSRLLYTGEGFFLQEYIDQLEKIQRRALRMVLEFRD